MSEIKQKSTAYQLVSTVYHGSFAVAGKSWARLNPGLHQAVHLAIDVGLHFDEEDFSNFYKDFNGGYWFTGDTMGEDFYRAAILLPHSEAIASYEKWRGRRPMMVENQRLWMGRSFQWDAQEVIVTSFQDGEDQSIIACAYKKIEHYGYGGHTRASGEGKPTKRYTVTWDDLKEFRRVQKEDQKKYLKAWELIKSGATQESAMSEVGLTETWRLTKEWLRSANKR